MKHLLNLIETSHGLPHPLGTLILVGAGKASVYAAQANQLAHAVILVDADAGVCQANQQLLGKYPTWQVLQATVAEQSGPAVLYSFNASRFNGLVAIEQLGKRPANLKQTQATEVEALGLVDLFQQLDVHFSGEGCALLIDIGDPSLTVLASVEPEQLNSICLVGMALNTEPNQQALQLRLQMARKLGLQMLTMQCDAAGCEPCYLYEAEAQPSLVTAPAIVQPEPAANAAYQALLLEMEHSKMVHMKMLDEAAHENQLLKAELSELKQRHQKFNEHMVRAESQLDLIKTLLFRDQTI